MTNRILVFLSVWMTALCLWSQQTAGAWQPQDLEDDELDEIVVVGYGTQRRTQLTGSVAKVSGEVFERSTGATLDVALSGSVAGLSITSESGQPGGGSSVRIRGGNSVNASNEPLYVVDGFIYYKDASATSTGLGALESSLNPLATINPLDIESVEVLKDVSATAIYGSRGANGVIIITTKRGNREGTRLAYRHTSGVDIVSRKLDLMNAQEWAQFQKTYFFNKGGYSDEEIAQLGVGTDWQSAMLRAAYRQTHELSANGGNERARFSLSGSHLSQDGVVVNTGFRRYNFHLNADWTVRSGLTLGTSSTYGRSVQSGLTTCEEAAYNSSPYSAGITNSFVYGLLTPQVVSIYADDGSYNYANPYEYAYFAIGSKKANAVSDLTNTTAESRNDYLLSNWWLQYAVGDFIAKATLGLSKEDVTQRRFSPSYTALGLAYNGIGGLGHRSNAIWQQEYTLTWNHDWERHHLDAMGGFTRQTSASDWSSVTCSDFTNESLGVNNLADASETYAPFTGTSEACLNSLIARLNYTLLDRYNATATLRADNSSRFASSHRWGVFPSLGLSWNASREAWLENSKKVSNLKVRTSYGVVGNQEIGDYEYSLSYQAARYNGTSSYTKTNAVNSDLKWETTQSFNAGIDIAVFRGRLDFVVDAYWKLTSDLLLEVPQGFATGVSTQLENVGNVRNAGIEFTANATLLRKKRLQWTASLNVAHNANCITDMGSTNNVILGAANQQILRKGEALGSFYGLRFIGVVQADEDVSSLPTVNGSTPTAGDAKYLDANGDGKITGDDRVVLGSIQPKLTGGLSSRLTFKRFDASLTLATSIGNEVYNALGRRLEQTGDSYNLLRTVLGSWTVDNPSNRYPYASNDRAFSYVDSRYIEDASYLKLRNLSLGYTFRLKPLELRLSATASNLFTITSYSGYDPEVATGTDSGAYPQARSFVVSVEITL